jgi:hypothetical protein
MSQYLGMLVALTMVVTLAVLTSCAKRCTGAPPLLGIPYIREEV